MCDNDLDWDSSISYLPSVPRSPNSKERKIFLTLQIGLPPNAQPGTGHTATATATCCATHHETRLRPPAAVLQCCSGQVCNDM